MPAVCTCYALTNYTCYSSYTEAGDVIIQLKVWINAFCYLVISSILLY